MTPEVLQRIEETFRRSSSGSGHLAKITFIRDILGENVPDKLSDVRFCVCVCVCFILLLKGGGVITTAL